MLFMLLSQFIFLCIYLNKKLKPIEYFMFIFKSNKNNNVHAPPPKNKILNDNKNVDDKIKAKKYIIIKDKTKKSINKNINIKNISGNLNNFDNKNDNSKKQFQSKNEVNNKDDTNKNNFEEILQNNSSIKNKNIKNNLLKMKSTSLDILLTKEKSNINHLEDLEDGQKNKIILANDFAPTINIQTPILNINHGKKNIKKINNLNSKQNQGKHQNLISNSRTSNELLYSINNKNNTKSGIFKKRVNIGTNMKNIETIAEVENNKEKEYIMRLYKTDEDLQDLDFEEAIFLDKRTYLRMYWSFLVDSQIILGTFCTENYLNLFVIKLSFFVCTFEISFFLNALFYTVDYISEAYHNNGVLNFVSGLPKSIYSFVATLIITNLLKMLSNSKSELILIILFFNLF